MTNKIISKKIYLLDKHLPKAMKYLKKCKLCPRNCDVNRLDDEKGFCGIGRYPIVAKIKLEKMLEKQFGEDTKVGSIYFASCSLRCLFCKDFKYSQTLNGEIYKPHDLAMALITLQEKGAQYINFVTPTHVVPQIMESLLIAYKKGFELPVIYNSSGFDVLKSLYMLNQIIDVYLIDFKYGNKELAKIYSFAFNYYKLVTKAIRLIVQQYYPNKFDDENKIVKGLVVNHLILPNDQSDSEKVFETLADIDKNILLNVFFNYEPEYKAFKNKLVNRKLNFKEIKKIELMVKFFGLDNTEFYY